MAYMTHSLSKYIITTIRDNYDNLVYPVVLEQILEGSNSTKYILCYPYSSIPNRYYSIRINIYFWHFSHCHIFYCVEACAVVINNPEGN